MAKPTDLPEWATDGGAVVTEPSLGKKQSGWLSPEKPSDGVWNWLHNKTYEWLDWLDTNTDGDYLIGRRLTAGTGITLSDNGDNTQLISSMPPATFNKITTGGEITIKSFASTKMLAVSLDCTSVSVGSTALIIDGVTKETVAAGSKTYRVLEASSSASVNAQNTGVNINAATLVGTTRVSAQSTFPTGVHVDDAGAWMFVADGTSDIIYRYSLSTAFLATSKVYGATAADTFDAGPFLVPSTGSVRDSGMSPDGLKLFVLEQTRIHQFTLATANTLGTTGSGAVTYDGSFSLTASGSSNSVGAAFSYDGAKMYVVDENDNLIRQFDLATAWRPLTASYASKSFAITSPTGVMVRPDGAKFYIINDTTDTVNQYSMTNGEVTTASNDSLTVAAGDPLPRGAYMRRDSLGFYVTGNSANEVNQFSSGNAWAGTAFTQLIEEA